MKAKALYVYRMASSDPDEAATAFLRTLMPGASEVELQDAYRAFDELLTVVTKIWHRNTLPPHADSL